MKPRCAPSSVSLPADSFPLAGGRLGGRPYGSPLQISKNVCANRETRAAQVCRPYGVGRRESQSWREAQGPPLRFQFPQRRSEASHKVLLRRVSCFAAKRGLIARERPRPASLGLRPIHLQKTLTVSLRAKCRRPAAVALRCALRGYLSHYLSLRNLIVPQRRSAASHKVLLPTFLSRKVGREK